MFKQKLNPVMIIVFSLIIAILSATLLTHVAINNPVSQSSSVYLDERRSTVMKLSAASLASSAAMTLLPGDVGTPIANKLADLSTYSLVILCAVFLEKYLVSITGMVAFRFLIPISCLLIIIHVLSKGKWHCKELAQKIALFALAIYIVIPASVMISKVIDHQSELNINQTIENAQESADEIEDNSSDSNILESFIKTIEGGTKGLTKKFETHLNNLIESFAVLIVTSVVIPILVFVFLVWVTKITFNLNFSMDPRHYRHHPES